LRVRVDVQIEGKGKGPLAVDIGVLLNALEFEIAAGSKTGIRNNFDSFIRCSGSSDAEDTRHHDEKSADPVGDQAWV
jgi:hypothetical protein